MARRERTDAELNAEIATARARAALEGTVEPRAVDAWYDADAGRVVMSLANGCLFAFPPSVSDALAEATPDGLRGVVVEQDGEALHWEDLDADISVPGIIARLLRLEQWAPRLLGQRTSAARARASRANGAKGGRPRKVADPAETGA